MRMWLLHPGLDNQYKLMFTLFIIGWLQVSDTQWLRSSVKGSREATHFWQVKMIIKSFTSEDFCLPLRCHHNTADLLYSKVYEQ